MIPNRATRWSSCVYILIGLAGVYGLTESSWPPTPAEGFSALGLVMMSVLAIRSIRSGVLVDDRGLVSRAELATRRLRWTEVARFESRGSFMANEVGAVRVDGDWVFLQYHPSAGNYVGLLERARLTEASESDRQAAAEAAVRHAALPAAQPRRRRTTWRLAAALLAYVALIAVVVRFELLPLGVALPITLVILMTSAWQGWSQRKRS